MNRLGFFGALATAALLAAGCGVAARPAAALAPAAIPAASALPPLRQISFKADVQPLFDNYCVACHQTGAAQQGLVLEEGLGRQRIVGIASSQAAMPLVTAGDPQKSYLLDKLNGTHLARGGNGTAMPPEGRLEAAAIALIEGWIAQGAIDN